MITSLSLLGCESGIERYIRGGDVQARLVYAKTRILHIGRFVNIPHSFTQNVTELKLNASAFIYLETNRARNYTIPGLNNVITS
jgi:hypothetical protein